MPLNPIPPGGIVPVPDESGGAGAPATVALIINANWENGIALVNKSFDLSNDVLAEMPDAPLVTVQGLDTSYVPPIKPAIFGDDPNEGRGIYDTARAEIDALLTNGFANFIATNFPGPNFYQDALAWCGRAINEGGTGIKANVESALWERARSRLTVEAQRNKATAISSFASRGFDLPPGALIHQVGLVDQDTRDKLAEQSRDISIEAFRAELENVRFAVTAVLDQRTKALSSALEYIRTLILGPQTAADLARTLTGLRSDFARNLVALYQAESAALDPRIRLTIADAELKSAGERANQSSKLQTQDAKTKTAMAHAQSVATIAAASLNGINAGASISGGDSSSLG